MTFAAARLTRMEWPSRCPGRCSSPATTAFSELPWSWRRERSRLIMSMNLRSIRIPQKGSRWLAIVGSASGFSPSSSLRKTGRSGGYRRQEYGERREGARGVVCAGGEDAATGRIKLETATNVKWGIKLCAAIYSTPAVAGGKIFVGGRQPGLVC